MADKIKKIDSNNFEISNSVVQNVDKKILKKEIGELQDFLNKRKAAAGIDTIEAEIAIKQDLLASLK